MSAITALIAASRSASGCDGRPRRLQGRPAILSAMLHWAAASIVQTALIANRPSVTIASTKLFMEWLAPFSRRMICVC